MFQIKAMTTDQGAGFSFSSRLRGWLWGLLLLIVTVAAYQPAWNGKPIWDDAAYMIANPLPTAAAELRKIWFSLDSPSQYFPLTFTAFFIERRLWGLNPAGYHLVNILLHAANALLLWQVLKRLRVPGAGLAAAIFALHPVQVESVAWISECKSVLMGLFFLLTLLAWIKFTDEQCHRPWPFYVLALFLFALALFAKTTACTLPAALLLILWLRKVPVNWRRLAQVAPFVAMGLGMGMVTVWWERFHQGTQGRLFDVGPVERLLIASRAVWFYAGKLLWPANLTFSYPRWTISVSDPCAYGWLLATVALGLVIWWARRWAGRSVEVAALFFVVTLSPVLGFFMLFTFLYSFVADHYQYLACIGPIALAGVGIHALFRRFGQRRRVWEGAFCAMLLAALGLLTWRQCRMYADLETLWRTTIDRNPDCWLAQNDLGALLYEKGQVDQAIIRFRSSLAIKPDNAEAQNNLGTALDKKGQLDEAIIRFRKAVVFRPAFAEAHRNLGNTLLRQGKVDQAIQEFQKAVAIRPDFAQLHSALANALLQHGQVEEAIIQFQETLALRPDDDQAHYNLGIALRQKGLKDKALLEFQQAAALRPDFAEAQNNLGNSLLQQGRVDEAVTHLRKALEIHPDYAQARCNLGNALLQKGLVDQAIIQFQKWLALQPESAQARNSLGHALLQQGRLDDAILEFQKALALQPGFVEARRNLAAVAWQMATSPNPSLRNGAKAIELARQTDQLTRSNDPMMGAILAAAYAETGRFNEAVAAARRALQLAARQDNAAMVAAIQAQLNCYQAGSPFRDTRAPP
jgi:tetratricopeptide (TPR) repeat protein